MNINVIENHTFVFPCKASTLHPGIGKMKFTMFAKEKYCTASRNQSSLIVYQKFESEQCGFSPVRNELSRRGYMRDTLVSAFDEILQTAEPNHNRCFPTAHPCYRRRNEEYEMAGSKGRNIRNHGHLYGHYR